MKRIAQRILYPKIKAGDYAETDQGSVKDFYLSLIPRDESMAFFQLLVIASYVNLVYAWNWAPLRYIQFKAPWEAFYLLGLVMLALQTLAVIANILRAEAFFPLQISSLVLAVVLIGSQYIFGGVSLTWSVIPEYLWLSFNLAILVGSNHRFKSWYFPLSVSRRMRPKGFPPRQPGRHRILLIDPGNQSYEWGVSARRHLYPPVLPYLAALVPKDWDVMILDQIHDEIDFDADTDIVGVTTMGRYFADIKEICRGFKQRGKTVMVGGPDCTVSATPYLDFTDAILQGNAEGFLPQILEDWKLGSLRKVYTNPVVFNLKGMPIPRYDLLPLRRYINQHNILVSTSCPYKCSFCTYNRTREPRLRPVEEVLAAVRATPAKFFWFEAPELLVYKNYVKELEAVFKDQKIEFSTHATMRSAADEENVRAAYSAGLRSVWLGLESYSQNTLNFINKKMNRVADYAKTFEVLDRCGVTASAHIMFGFPDDTREVYEDALKGLIKGKTSFVGIHIVGTYSGDDAFKSQLLTAGGRPLELLSHLGSKKDVGHLLFKPSGFTDLEFANAVEKFHNEYYSIFNIMRRILTRSARNFPNLAPDLLMSLIFKCYGRTIHGEPVRLAQAIDELYDLPSGQAAEIMRREKSCPTEEALPDFLEQSN